MRNRILITLGALFLLGLVLRFGFGIGMSRADLHISAAAEPLACIGGVIEGEHCSPGTILPFTNAVLMTIIIDLVLLLLVFLGLRNMQLVPRGIQNVLEAIVEGVYNFALGVDRKNVAKFFALPMTILLFFGVANLGALIPGVGAVGNCMVKEKEETSLSEGGPATVEGQAEAPAAPAEANTQATGEQSAFRGLPGYCGDGNFIIPWLRAPAADLNVTLAFALVAMFMVQFFGFQALGLGYLTKFFNFKEGFLGAFLGLIELISEIGRIISFAFRMFGNIFGGEVILVVMAYLFPYILPLPFYGFEVFVALMQALIFAVLTLIFFSLAVTAHGGHDEHDDDHGHGVQQFESDVSRTVTTEANHVRV